MDNTIYRSAAWPWIIAVLVAISGNSATLQAAESSKKDFPETIAVLQMLYGSEVRAGYRYEIYAQVAADEGHGNISHLLTAIAASEAVHARNFERILTSFGVKPAHVDVSSIDASSTKRNLRYATDVELSEIDKEYPRYLGRIQNEKHAEAIEYITYAWQAEKDHRELIKEIRSGTGMFFHMLLNYFRSNPSRYYVNQNCGATVTELPLESCPICHEPLETYTEIQPELQVK